MESSILFIGSMVVLIVALVYSLNEGAMLYSHIINIAVSVIFQ